MEIQPTGIDGAWVVTPNQSLDERGVFLESFRLDKLEAATGHRLEVRQTNVSVSSRGVLRGIHFAFPPPGQAKYVTAATGSFLDFTVDIRLGSPTYGEWDVVRLDARDRRAVLIEEGLGHALYALEDRSTALYLCSQVYDPSRERSVYPLDPAVGLTLPPDIDPLLSEKDRTAPTLHEAQELGILPTHDRTSVGSLRPDGC